MKKLVLLSLLSIFSLFQVLQAQPELFSRVLLGANLEDIQVYDMVPTHHDSYFFVGDNWSQTGFMVGAIDLDGNPLWSSVLSRATGGRPLNMNRVISTYDSCILISGNTYTESGDVLSFFVKMDALGNTLWSKTVDYGLDIYPVDILQTMDSGYVVLGSASFSSAPYSKMVVSKLDTSCNPEWTKVIQVGEYGTYAVSIQQSPGGGYLVLGNAKSEGSYTTERAILLKLSPLGEFNSGRSYSTTGSSIATHAINFLATENRNYTCINSGSNLSFLTTDTLGGILSDHSYNEIPWGNMYDIEPRLHATTDGFVGVFGGDYYSKLVKFNELGEYQFAKNLYLLTIDLCISPNNEILAFGNGPILGVKGQATYSIYNIGLIQMDDMGNGLDCVEQDGMSPLTDTIQSEFLSAPIFTTAAGVVSTLPLTITPTTMETREGCIDFVGSVSESPESIVKVYPNPCQDKLTIHLLNESAGTLEIVNGLGQMVVKQMISEKETTLDLSGYPDGIYLYRFTDVDKKISSGKIILRR